MKPIREASKLDWEGDSMDEEKDAPWRKKENWGKGPWQNEPDKMQWTVEFAVQRPGSRRRFKMPAIAVRGPMGAWCGYVGVTKGHPFFGVTYSSCSKGCAVEPHKPTTDEDIANAKTDAERNLMIAGKKFEETDLSKRMREEHPRFVCDYDAEHSPESVLNVHGGITYSDFCQEGGQICHVPRKGETGQVYWFGFDCSHAWDQIPAMDALHKETELRTGFRWPHHFRMRDVYRNKTYVRRETERLARQLAVVL